MRERKGRVTVLVNYIEVDSPPHQPQKKEKKQKKGKKEKIEIVEGKKQMSAEEANNN